MKSQPAINGILRKLSGKGKYFSTRKATAVSLIRRGVPQIQAMAQAGYSRGTVKSRNDPGGILAQAREDYLVEFARQAEKSGYDGGHAAEILINVARNGERDFDRCQAVKIHSQILHGAGRNGGGIHIGKAIVVVPGIAAGVDWGNQVKEIKT